MKVNRRDYLKLASTGIISTFPFISQTSYSKDDQEILIDTIHDESFKYNPKLVNKKVIIIGAGPSGLATAYFLSKAGINTTLIEASPTIGGKVAQKKIDNFNVDIGAQTIHSSYVLTSEFEKIFNLKNQIIKTEIESIAIRNKKLFSININKPVSILFDNYITFSEWLELAIFLKYGERTNYLKDSKPLSSLLKYDKKNAQEFYETFFSQSTIDYGIQPFQNGLLFQNPTESSLIVPRIILSQYINDGYIYQYKKGIRQLTTSFETYLKKINRITIQKNIDVKSLKDLELKYQPDKIVLATSSFNARLLMKNTANEYEKTVLNTSYTPVYVWLLSIDNNYIRQKTQGAIFIKNNYMMCFPLSEGHIIASIVFDKRPNRTIFKIFIPANGHKKDHFKDKIENIALTEITKYFKGIKKHIRSSNYHFWKNATPKLQTGYLKNIIEYQEQNFLNKKVLLCGEYLSIPSIEGAFQSAHFIAKKIIKSFDKSS